jgi:4-amino-4-deoxy-L-arabinose transferase-like glycosyltransferase
MTAPAAAAPPPAAAAAEPAHRLALWHIALLILVAAALFWPGQTTLPPVDRDETRFAQATVQMLESGEYVDIRLQEDPRWLQPAGIYWLQSATVALLSDAEARAIWAHRLPSFLAAIAAVLLAARLGARMFGGPAGLLAGLLLASTVLLNVEARLAKIDATLLVTILLAQSALWRAYEARDGTNRPGWGWAVLFWAAVGAGILLKGPINPMVVGLTILVLCVLERRVAWLLALRPLAGLAIAAAIALPWYVAIHIETDGGFFQRSAGQNFLGKIFEGEQGHGFPPGYHLLVSFAAMWPALPLLALALPWIWRSRRRPAVRFCLAWALPTWIVYELVATKLPHYVLPAYPALLILAAAAAFALRDGLVKGEGWWPRRLFWPVWIAFLVVGIGLAAGPLGIALATDGEASRAAFSVALAALALVLWVAVALRRGQVLQAAYTMPAAAFLAVSLNLGITFPGVDTIWFNREIPRVAEQVAPCPGYRIATAPLDLESVVFLTDTDTVIEAMHEIEAMLRDGPGCAVLFLEDPQADRLRAALGDTGLDWRDTGRRVTGFNFSNGRWVDLGVYVVE